MKRIDQRYARFRESGSPPWEAKKLAARPEPLASPVMKAIKRDRRVGMREAKRPGGSGVRAYWREISFDYAVQGYEGVKGREKGVKQPRKMVADVADRPAVKASIKAYRTRTETPVGYAGRVRILKRAGFFDFEARRLARMRDIDIDKQAHTFKSRPWQAMIRNHSEFMDRMLAKAIGKMKRDMGAKRFSLIPKRQLISQARVKVENMLRTLWAAGKWDPFDWLKKEYRPKKVLRVYDARPSTKRARSRTKALMGTRKQAVMFFD